MSSHLVRRGGIWWVRLSVPQRLRKAAGRREFNQSCRTHEIAIAKLVAVVLLAAWRKRLLQLDSHSMTIDVLKLIEGSPALSGVGWLPLVEAVGATGIGQDRILRSAADGGLKLFCRLSQVHGHTIGREKLVELNDVMIGLAGGFVIPQPQPLELGARPCVQTGVLALTDSAAIAASILAKANTRIGLVAFDVANQLESFFAPDVTVEVDVEKLEALASDIEALRKELAGGVPADAIARATELRRAGLASKTSMLGKNAKKRFSEGVDAYSKTASGLPGDLTSESEQRHRINGLLLFGEFMGDLLLSEIDSEKLRAFRDGPLRTFPAKANSLPKRLKRSSMKETVEAIRTSGEAWPTMTLSMRNERMLALGRLFAWLRAQKWIEEDPAVALRGESGLTKAEHKELKRETDDDDEGRGPFGDDDLALIFGQSWFKTGSGAEIKRPSYWYPFEYWLPLLGLFAGCRIKEAAQLHLSDVKVLGSGVWCLDINESTKDKSLKNETSRRIVPIHPKLLDLGFLEYCDRLSYEGFRRVFPELTWATSDAKYAKEPVRKMSSMMAKLGMPRDNTHVFHCLRHNMNNGLIRVPLISLSIADEGLKNFARYSVMGHKPGKDVNIGHYTSVTPEEVIDLIKRVNFNLPAIAKFDVDEGVRQVALALSRKTGPRRGLEDMGLLIPNEIWAKKIEIPVGN